MPTRLARHLCGTPDGLRRVGDPLNPGPASAEGNAGDPIDDAARPVVGRPARLEQVVENVAESTTACLLAMVQGNVLALGLGHWVIASQTGLAAGLLATLAVYLSRGRGRWMIAGVLAIATASVDYLVHPGGFGPVAFEALVTGLAAGAFSLVVAKIRRGGPAAAATPRNLDRTPGG